MPLLSAKRNYGNKIANEENGECVEWIDEDYLELNETTPPSGRKSSSAHLFIKWTFLIAVGNK